MIATIKLPAMMRNAMKPDVLQSRAANPRAESPHQTAKNWMVGIPTVNQPLVYFKTRSFTLK
jgi:hypothetical protein